MEPQIWMIDLQIIFFKCKQKDFLRDTFRATTLLNFNLQSYFVFSFQLVPISIEESFAIFKKEFEEKKKQKVARGCWFFTKNFHCIVFNVFKKLVNDSCHSFFLVILGLGFVIFECQLVYVKLFNFNHFFVICILFNVNFVSLQMLIDFNLINKISN